MSNVYEAWKCGECGGWHDDEYEARDCCRPSISEGYKCGECGAYHDDKADAEECCQPDEPTQDGISCAARDDKTVDMFAARR